MKSEAIRYFENAKELLRKAPIKENWYVDVKPVQEACGTAYLAVLKAIDQRLLKAGIPQQNLPKSVETYHKALKEHLSVRNGKLAKQFGYLYDELHIAGYYRGFLRRVETVKSVLHAAKEFIEKLS